MSVALKQEAHCSVLILDRPDKRNALNIEMSEQISDALRQARRTPAILLIRSSTPGVFVAGADIGDLSKRTRIEAMRRLNQELFQLLEDHPWPTIAVVDGPALGGGCELALACDFRIGSTRSVWGLPEVTLGIIPSAGGLWRLPRLVGWSAATELILSGQSIGAQSAYDIGLIHRLTDPEGIEAAVDSLVGSLSKASLTAVSYAKEAMREPAGRRRLADAAVQALCFESQDAHDRLTAFRPRPLGTV